jgi:hypothetical protein
MKTMLILLMTALLIGCQNIYWREGTSKEEGKEDVDRCYEKTIDAWKEGQFPWRSLQCKQYFEDCMRQKGYVLRNRNEVYPNNSKLKPAIKEDAPAKVSEQSDLWVTIWPYPIGSLYHVRPCSTLPQQATYQSRTMLLEDAVKAGYKPCPHCFP